MSTIQPERANNPQERFRNFWHAFRLLGIGLLFVGICSIILLFPVIPTPDIYDLSLGDIAPEDIEAPREITYVSVIDTNQARLAAAQTVEDVFTQPDPRVGRQQVLKARQVMDFINDVRLDSYADDALKETYLAEITALDLTPEAMAYLIHLPASQFNLVENEVVSLIEDVMSNTVREGYIEEVTSQLELQISPDMPEELIPLTLQIARQLIIPNSLLNIVETEAARDAAMVAVPDIRHTYQQGEIVIRAGERVDERGLEALNALGLATDAITWKDVASAILLSLLSGCLLAVFLVLFGNEWLEQPLRLLLLVGVTLGFVFLAQIMVPAQGILAYLLPAAALILTLNTLVSIEYAVLAAIVYAILVGYLSNGSLAIAAYSAITSMFAAGALRRTSRLNAFFLAGLAAAAGGIATLLVFQLPAQTDPGFLAQFILIALMNGLLSAGIALVLLFVIGSLTGITTSLKLIDLMRPDHPLQRQLQQEALGTYQHTLSVANIAEAVAEAVGADTLLTRVGTLYHDIGKTSNPGFFVENRTEGSGDPHEGLSPLSSAKIILSHVTDGVDLARRKRLPPRVIDFIKEHHGTMPAIFFLHKAREEAAEAGAALDEQAFYYEGPTPQSPETAILMLADGCESAARANKPSSSAEIEALVTRIVQQRLDLGQLDDSGLTLTQIKIIKESIVRTLKGMYHPRVRYPTDQPAARLSPGAQGALSGGPSEEAVEGMVVQEAGKKVGSAPEQPELEPALTEPESTSQHPPESQK